MLPLTSSKTSEASGLHLQPLSAVARPAPETARKGNEMRGWDHYFETISSCHWAKAQSIDMDLCHPSSRDHSPSLLAQLPFSRDSCWHGTPPCSAKSSYRKPPNALPNRLKL